MSKTRLARAAALGAAAAALLVLLFGGSVAPAEDLQSKLESKEEKLSHVRARRGVLTTTISSYGNRIEALTGQVATLRTEESAVRGRLDAKQAELDHALSELGVARKHLVVLKARLHRALVTLRERLVAIYETGNPNLLNVILSAENYGNLVDRAEYLNRLNGMDEAVVGRVRELLAYPDDSAAAAWDADSPDTPPNSMLYLILSPDSVTVVLDDSNTADMRAMLEGFRTMLVTEIEKIYLRAA